MTPFSYHASQLFESSERARKELQRLDDDKYVVAVTFMFWVAFITSALLATFLRFS